RLCRRLGRRIGDLLLDNGAGFRIREPSKTKNASKDTAEYKQEQLHSDGTNRILDPRPLQLSADLFRKNAYTFCAFFPINGVHTISQRFLHYVTPSSS